MSTDARDRAGTTTSVACAAEPDDAWAHLADPRRWPDWVGGVRRVTVTRGNAARPPMVAGGQLLVVHGPWPLSWRLRVDAVDRPRSVAWTAAIGPWRLQAEHHVEATNGDCRLVARHRLSGPAAAALSTAVRRWMRRGLERLGTTAVTG